MTSLSATAGRRLVTGLALSLALLGAVEGVLRAVGFRHVAPEPPPLIIFTQDIDAQMETGSTFYKKSRDLLWEHKEGAQFSSDAEDVVNDLGFRGETLPPPVEGGPLRIACLGDSSTFGAKVAADETFSHQLEVMLRAAGQDADVLNAGVIGYSSWQSRLLLEQRLWPLQPDIVVLYLGAINDGRPAKPLPDRDKLAKAKERAPLSLLLLGATQKLRLGQLLRKQLVDLGLVEEKRFMEKIEDQGFRLRDELSAITGEYTMRVPLDEFQDNVRACVQQCREHGAKPVLVIPTRRESMEAETPYQVRYSEALPELGQELGVVCLDVRRKVREAPGGTAAHHIEGSRVHPNPAGHRLIARMLANWVSGEAVR